MEEKTRSKEELHKREYEVADFNMFVERNEHYKEKNEDLVDYLKHVQEERLEASRQADF